MTTRQADFAAKGAQVRQSRYAARKRINRTIECSKVCLSDVIPSALACIEGALVATGLDVFALENHRPGHALDIQAVMALIHQGLAVGLNLGQRPVTHGLELRLGDDLRLLHADIELLHHRAIAIDIAHVLARQEVAQGSSWCAGILAQVGIGEGIALAIAAVNKGNRLALLVDHAALAEPCLEEWRLRASGPVQRIGKAAGCCVALQAGHECRLVGGIHFWQCGQGVGGGGFAHACSAAWPATTIAGSCARLGQQQHQVIARPLQRCRLAEGVTDELAQQRD